MAENQENQETNESGTAVEEQPQPVEAALPVPTLAALRPRKSGAR